MDLTEFKQKLDNGDIPVPGVHEGKKVKGNVIKKTEEGVLVSCENDTFIGIILPKEAKELQRNEVDLSQGTKLEAEVMNLDAMDDEGYFVISISKLLQYDVWNSIMDKVSRDETITVKPTEANLGGLLVDMHGIKGFIPLSQLAPVNYPRVEDGDQEKIFEKLVALMGQEFKVRVINIDEEGKRLILSEREALREEKEEIEKNLDIGAEFDGIISGISSYGLFVTIGGGIEGLVHVSEITYGHVDSISKFGSIGDEVRVKVIGQDNGKISLSMKKLKPDPWSIIPKQYKIGDIVEGEVIRFVPYGVFIRVYDDINGLIHLSELSSQPISNPAEVVKPGQKVRAKIILMEPEKRKMGLSVKALEQEEGKSKQGKSTSSKTKTTSKSSTSTGAKSKSTTSKQNTSKTTGGGEGSRYNVKKKKE